MDMHQYFTVNNRIALQWGDWEGVAEVLDYIKTTKFKTNTNDSWIIRNREKIQIAKVAPRVGKKFDYKELQRFVGGLIQVVPVVNDQYDDWRDFVILVNEEGILLNLPMSPVSRGGNYFKGHTLFGDVLIVHESSWE